jgi:hypothetical protein
MRGRAREKNGKIWSLAWKGFFSFAGRAEFYFSLCTALVTFLDNF